MSCQSSSESNSDKEEETATTFSGASGEVKLMTLDPGHFHAALIQKTMYKQVNPEVYVYAPEGDDVSLHMKRVEGFNTRAESPTSWKTKLYTGADFFEKMLSDNPGNLLVLSGNNAKKTEYILKAVQNSIQVLADKPMVITPEEFPMLEQAFQVAAQNGVLLYDVMTERHEITTMLQKELAHIPEVFGAMQKGTPEEPAITKESVHHFFKYVAGNPLVRPAWFFDVTKQGEGLVDVNTHLVDLVQWETYPELVLSKSDVQILDAKHWTTDLTPEMFKKVTQLDSYPDYLAPYLEGDTLKVYSNGEVTYQLKDIIAKTSVIWNFEAPEGAKDTHYSIMRGSMANLIIQQGAEENYQPTLYIETIGGNDITAALEKAVNNTLQASYPGITLTELGRGKWQLNIPDKYKVGHEAHFGQVTEKYLQYLIDGKLPEWEVPNMIVKYYITTEALKRARQ